MNAPAILDMLLEAGAISPLSCHFARFIARQSMEQENSMLVLTCALLSESNQRGNVCLDLTEYAGASLFDTKLELRLPDAPALEDWQAALRASDCVGEAGDTAPLILVRNRLYLQRFWNDEQSVLQAIAERLLPAREINRQRLQEGLDRLYRKTEHRAAANEPDWQKIAAALAVSRRFAVISGGPGTGKTTTVVKVLALLLDQNPALRLRLAAPTGKAAARMVESIRVARAHLQLDSRIMDLLPDSASTLHRLLGYQGGAGRRGFRHNRHNPLPVDCLVIDEASMIDLVLMRALLEATPLTARVILLGDRDQLASVEAGNVLGDITGHGQSLHYTPDMAELLADMSGCDRQTLPMAADSPAVADSIALLRISHRFAPDSGIGRLARLVNAGAAEQALALLEESKQIQVADLQWLQPAESERNPLNRSAIEWALLRYSEYLDCDDVSRALALFGAARILCAVHEGPLGDVEINRLLAERLRGRGLLEAGDDCHGKPVMVTVNDYELELFNGDTGLLWRSDSGELEACFPQLDGQVRKLPARSLPEHVTAWAMTVHKSQGSEFDQVLLVLPTDVHSPLLLRELLYTGITRARSTLLLHTAADAFASACRTPVRRSSGLAELLGWSSRQE